MVPDGEFLAICWVLLFQRAARSTFQAFILNCGGMADIQSATAEIRRRKKRKIEEETTGQKYNVRICYAGRP